MKNHRMLATILLIFVLVLTACGPVEDYGEEGLSLEESSCPAGMVYDAEWDECVSPEELEWDEEGSFLDLLDSMFTDDPEDCYEDEIYDPELEQCVFTGEEFESVSSHPTV